MTKEEKLQTEVITTEQAIYCMNHQYNYEKYECDYCPYCLLCEEKGIEGKMIKMAIKALEENDGLKEYLDKANRTNSQLIQHIEKNNMNIDTSLAIERYQDLVEYFSDKDAAKTILGDREEFKKWLKRIKWNVRKVDELARKLEQKPCEDTVNRAEVVDELNRLGRNAFKDDTDYDNFFAFLDSLPSVTPTQEWIPCSEGLPLERHAVLVRTAYTTYCAYLEDGKWYIFGAYEREVNEVTAWTPLPKYDGEQKDD